MTSDPKDPLYEPAPSGSETLLPSESLRLVIELMRPAGPELARRWVAALMLVPESDRETVVAEVEARVAQLYSQSEP